MEPYFLNLEGLSMPQTLVVLLLDPKSAETFAMTSIAKKYLKYHPFLPLISYCKDAKKQDEASPKSVAKMPTVHQELVFGSSSAIDRCLVLSSKSSRKNWKK